jgi:predicted metal-dependent hydrolase
MSKRAEPFRCEVAIGEERLHFTVQPDARLRANGRWTLHGDTVTLRVPNGMPRAAIDVMVERIAARIKRSRARADKQTDQDLMARAAQLNAEYFAGELSWRSIRWADNMRLRLGSCSSGGASDGDIRISTVLRRYPPYVLDYVIAHEICHRKYPDHSAAFWAYLARFPHTERARGFLEGVAFAGGTADADAD